MKNQAISNFSNGYNCSQAVLSVFCEEEKIDKNTMMMISVPFGGGISGTGNICGCVSGALLAIGLLKGQNTVNNPENRKMVYNLSREFCARFKEKHKYLNCRDLIKKDLTNPDEYEQAIKAGIFKNRCSMMVSSAVEIVKEIIERPTL